MASPQASRAEVNSVPADYLGGGFILCISNPCDEAAFRLASTGTQQALVNFAGWLGALFGLYASLSVHRRDGRHFTRLRYPCARLTQESSAI